KERGRRKEAEGRSQKKYFYKYEMLPRELREINNSEFPCSIDRDICHGSIVTFVGCDRPRSIGIFKISTATSNYLDSASTISNFKFNESQLLKTIRRNPYYGYWNKW
ncbi:MULTISPECIES: hypothetical protein, partial [unclassified Microcoleus]